MQGEQPDNSARKEAIRLRAVASGRVAGLQRSPGLSFRPTSGRAMASTVCTGWERLQIGSVSDLEERRTMWILCTKKMPMKYLVLMSLNITEWLKTAPQTNA